MSKPEVKKLDKKTAVKNSVVQNGPTTGTVTDIIPTITSAVGNAAKDKADKALDSNPKVKKAIDTATAVAPLVVGAINTVT